MDDWIQKLTHENELFEEQWPSIYEQIKTHSIPDDPFLVLTSLENYVRQESMNNSIVDVKFLFVDNVLDKLVDEEVSISIDQLVHLFVRSIGSMTTMNQFDCHWLKQFYVKFELGEKLKQEFVRTDLIAQILDILSTKVLTFQQRNTQEEWHQFLTSKIFSDSNEDENTLNQSIIVKSMINQFQEFYKQLIQKSTLSSLSLKLVQILQISDPDIFNVSTVVMEGVSRNETLVQTFSSEYVSQLVRSYSDHPQIIETNAKDILNTFEQLLINEQLDEANQILSKLITHHMNFFDIHILIKLFIRFGPIVQEKDIFLNKILRPFICALEKASISKDLAIPLFNLGKMILNLHCLDAPNWTMRLLERQDFYPWQDLHTELVELLSICASYEKISNENYFSPLDDLEKVIEFIHRKSQKYPSTIRLIHSIAVDNILRWANIEHTLDTHVYRMGGAMLSLIDKQQVNEDLCLKWINSLRKSVDRQTEGDNRSNSILFSEMGRYLGDWISHIQVFSHVFHQNVAKLLEAIVEHPLYDEDLNMTVSHIILAHTLFKVATVLAHENDLRLYEHFLDELCRKQKNQEHDQPFQIQQWWENFWIIVGCKFPSVAVDHLDQFLHNLINEKHLNFVSLIFSIVMQYPDRILPYWDALIDILLADHCQYFFPIHGLCVWIIKNNPKVVQLKHIDAIFTALDLIPFNQELCLLIQSLGFVASGHPEFFDPYLTKLIRLVIDKQNLFIFECLQKYLIASMILHSKIKLDDILNVLVNLLRQENFSTDLRQEIFFTCIQIGIKHREFLLEHQADLGGIEFTCLLNFINDTITSETDQSWIRRARLELEQIEHSIAVTKKENEKKIIQTTPITDYSNEISHDPCWLLQATKLLNRRKENDWRLLAQKLGYTSAEIKYWSMEPNPSMILLKDWLTINENNVATQHLVQCLNELDRNDVEQIIRQDAIVSGHPILEMISLTIRRHEPILISFDEKDSQLMIQLAEHLKSAGYLCQMCNQSISRNELEVCICGARIILCYSTVEYLSLDSSTFVSQCATKFKKPLIHLLKDQNTMPSDNLSEIISLHNQITCEKWSEESFIELLAQIRYYLAPNPDLIEQQYRHWLYPRVDSLIFLKQFFIRDITLTTIWKNLPLTINHPQSVLSYDWNNLHDALILYQKLTQLGYRIYLDVFQMAGWKPLKEKVQEAISQSACLLACVTPQYIQSLRGLHEISVARYHEKPIVFLVLEKTNLEAIMHPKDDVIDFSNGTTKQEREEKSFETLLVRFKHLIPEVQTNKPRYLIEMQRPQSARIEATPTMQRPKRISSASTNPRSTACSLM